MSKNTLETYVREVRSGRLSNEEKDVKILSDHLNAQEKTTDKGRLGYRGELLPRKESITMVA